jgi:hypothetical protein
VAVRKLRWHRRRLPCCQTSWSSWASKGSGSGVSSSRSSCRYRSILDGSSRSISATRARSCRRMPSIKPRTQPQHATRSPSKGQNTLRRSTRQGCTMYPINAHKGSTTAPIRQLCGSPRGKSNTILRQTDLSVLLGIF